MRSTAGIAPSTIPRVDARLNSSDVGPASSFELICARSVGEYKRRYLNGAASRGGLVDAVLASLPHLRRLPQFAPALLHRCSTLELDDRPGRAAIPQGVICECAAVRRVAAR
jgi:hypothetical protein